jgi:hypothetical protein
MVEILRASNKIITLDGDMNNRSYTFLNKFGKSINIYNTINFNKFKIKVINDKNEFLQMVINDFSEGKKLFIPCMPNGFAEDIENNLINASPNKAHRVKIYNSNQSDKIKETDMKTILDTWSDLDCVITTPTIEAGVSYDCERFDKIYGVISENSCSQRSFFQMLARVRKIKDKEIIILNYSNFRLNECLPWVYDEVKQGLLLSNELLLDRRIDNKYCLNIYQENYIYNRLEELK